jgi:hypothetical protein
VVGNALGDWLGDALGGRAWHRRTCKLLDRLAAGEALGADARAVRRHRSMIQIHT